MAKTVYDFTVKDIDGNDVSLSKYKGRLLLIVNVASQCGYTDSNYKSLQATYEEFKDNGLSIAAFPCNQVNFYPQHNNKKHYILFFLSLFIYSLVNKNHGKIAK